MTHTNRLKDCHYSFSAFQILFCFKYSSPNHEIQMQQKSKFFLCLVGSLGPDPPGEEETAKERMYDHHPMHPHIQEHHHSGHT